MAILLKRNRNCKLKRNIKYSSQEKLKMNSSTIHNNTGLDKKFSVKGENTRHNLSSSIILMTIILVFLIAVSGGQLHAQENHDKFQVEKLLVYIESSFIPLETLRQAIPFVTFVQEKDQANVLVEIAKSSSNSQEIYTVKFTGLKELSGRNYTVEYPSFPNQEPESLQKELVRVVRNGLIPYTGLTPEASKIKIQLEQEVKPTAVTDPWNFWVFSLSANSFLNGQKGVSYDNIYSNFSANRVTPEWKIRISLSGNYSRNSYEYEGMSYASSSRGGSFRTLIARSLGEHWSVGSFLNVTSSTYQNINLGIMVSPAIEYNIFPYSESTRRQLRITYSVGLGPTYYREETIFDKTREFLVRENLAVTLELKKKWGSISTSIEGSHYFHDFSKYRIEFNNDISVRLFRGFSVNIDGGYARIHDLISIAKAGASWEDVLLMRKQLATSYDYYFSVGISYSFGSIFSNVVNPRFGSGSSGFSMSIGY